MAKKVSWQQQLKDENKMLKRVNAELQAEVDKLRVNTGGNQKLTRRQVARRASGRCP